MAERSQGIATAANKGTPQIIILLSGDGGMSELMNVLAKNDRSSEYQPPILCLIAMGTGNALANSLSSHDHTKGLKLLFQGEPRPIPVFRVLFSEGSQTLFDEGRQFESVPLISNSNKSTPGMFGVVVFSWGLHASLVADSDTTEWRKQGSERFGMVAKELLSPADGSPAHIYKGRITISKFDADGQVAEEVMHTHEHEYVLATLVPNLQEGFTISPDSEPLDGQLRLVHFGPTEGTQVMDIMGKAYQGGAHVKDERVTYEPISRIRIDFEEDDEDSRWRRVCVDGTIVQVPKGGWVEAEMMDIGNSPVQVMAPIVRDDDQMA